MSLRFADTYYFLALLSPEDAGHERATAASRQSRERRDVLVTTAWVLTELADALASSRNRNLFSQTLAAIRADPRFRIVPPTEGLFDRGVELYEKRSDKDWSLTDCISFVVMDEKKITEAFAYDQHFSQAGFGLV